MDEKTIIDEQYIIKLIESGVDLNKQRHHNLPLIFISNYKITKLLIEAGVDLNIRDDVGSTALMINDNTQLLLDAGANPHLKDNNDRTMLYYLKWCPDVDIDHITSTSLNYVYSYYNGLSALGSVLVDFKFINIDFNDNVLNSLEHEKYINFIKLLLKSGGSPNIKDNFGSTLLCTQNNPIIIKLLLEYGADPNITDKTGSTPLHIQDDLNIIKLLLKYKINVHIINRSKNNALYYHKNPDIIEILLDTGIKYDLILQPRLTIHVYKKYIDYLK